MTEAVTPVAAVAAPTAPAEVVTPVAAAPAPAAAPTPAPAPAPTAPAATDESIFPVVAPEAPAAPVKAEADMTPAEKIAAAQAVVDAAKVAADPNSGKAWVLQEGVLGVGEKPSWFKDSKYKNVAAQAEAYNALEARFGAFVGAPKEGKYEVKLPEGVAITNQEHPVLVEFNKWATKNQLSNEGYNQVLGYLAQYEQAQQPSMGAIKSQLGENADARITAAAGWVKASLGDEGFQLLRTAGTGKQAAAVLTLVEKLMGKAVQPRMPKPGDDVQGVRGGPTLESIKAKQGERDAQGKSRYATDPKFRAEVLGDFKKFYDANPVNRDRSGNNRA
jgi:hypothetical protein